MRSAVCPRDTRGLGRIFPQYLEDYRSFIANPVFTPEGRPIMLTIEDACRIHSRRRVRLNVSTAAPAATTARQQVRCWECADMRR